MWVGIVGQDNVRQRNPYRTPCRAVPVWSLPLFGLECLP
jgi:hypothetical protein